MAELGFTCSMRKNVNKSSVMYTDNIKVLKFAY